MFAGIKIIFVECWADTVALGFIFIAPQADNAPPLLVSLGIRYPLNYERVEMCWLVLCSLHNCVFLV